MNESTIQTDRFPCHESEACPSRFRKFRLANLIWRGNDPGLLLGLSGILVGLIMAFPLVYVFWRASLTDLGRWQRLLDNRIPSLLINTLLLTAGTTLLSLFVGGLLAWLVYRCDIPGRKLWRWVFALPLMMPSYVGAVAYIMLLGPAGWLRQALNVSPFDIYSFGGVLLVMTLFKFPYVFLVVGAALRRMNRTQEEVARSLGQNSWQVFWKVHVPMLRPAFGAGAILTALCVLSEFGVVALLRYNTFASAIFYQLEGFDRDAAAILSTVLIVLTLFFLYVESKNHKRRYEQTGGDFAAPAPIRLKKTKPLAMLFVLAVFSLSVVLPLGVLARWTVQGLTHGALNASFIGHAANSVLVAGLAALLSMILALPVVYLHSRHPSFFSRLILKLSSSGYALPGVIVALGLIFFFNQYVPFVYNTFLLIAFAYLIRFLPQAVQYSGASLRQVTPSVDEAARNLGHSPLKTLLKVILPLILPGVLAGGALVFVSSIKELPATLLLRPPGFDTLAVRVWVESSEAIYHMAAPAALLITLISIAPLKLLMKKY